MEEEPREEGSEVRDVQGAVEEEEGAGAVREPGSLRR